MKPLPFEHPARAWYRAERAGQLRLPGVLPPAPRYEGLDAFAERIRKTALATAALNGIRQAGATVAVFEFCEHACSRECEAARRGSRSLRSR